MRAELGMSGRNETLQSPSAITVVPPTPRRPRERFARQRCSLSPGPFRSGQLCPVRAPGQECPGQFSQHPRIGDGVQSQMGYHWFWEIVNTPLPHAIASHNSAASGGPGGDMPDPTQGPTALRLVLGLQLRQLRDARHISAADAARAIRATPSKISRIELGRSAIKEIDVLDLLTYYGVDAAER